MRRPGSGLRLGAAVDLGLLTGGARFARAARRNPPGWSFRSPFATDTLHRRRGFAAGPGPGRLPGPWGRSPFVDEAGRRAMPVAPRTARAAAPARGNRASAKEKPTVRSNPVESLAKVLSQRCRELPEMIGREKPGPVTGFAELSGRSRCNPSRRPRTVPRCGLSATRSGRLSPRCGRTGGSGSDAAP